MSKRIYLQRFRSIFTFENLHEKPCCHLNCSLAVGAQLATSLTIVGAWIGALIGSYPAEVYGRRPTLLGNNLFFICGAVLAATGNVYALYLGRFISGIHQYNVLLVIASGSKSSVLRQALASEWVALFLPCFYPRCLCLLHEGLSPPFIR